MTIYKAIILSLSCCLLLGIRVVAQSSYDDANAIALPSANNDFLKSQPDFNVYTYTGAPEITVPIYSLGSKVLTIPISLSYNSAGGIRVQDVANFAGLGWKLHAGGNVSRVVRGLPDEQNNGYIGINGAGKTVSAGINNTMVGQIGSGQLDGEPDLFTVTTPFFSFMFVLDANGNPVFADNTGFRITDNLYMNSNLAAGTFWVITDDDGNQYFFGSTSDSRENMTTSLAGTSPQSFTTTWYLDKIVAFNNRDVITLAYTSGNDYSVSHNMSSLTTWATSPSCSTPNSISSNYTITYTYNSPKYISEIYSSLGNVEFSYAFDRSDIPNAGRLTGITVYSAPVNHMGTASTALKSFQFGYSYFNPQSNDPNVLRLELNSITLADNGTDAPLPYKTFDYNTTVNLPARNSVEFDYLGYYNTNTSGTAIAPTANKNPDPNRATADILVGIHDLSGETQKLYYELNQTYDPTSGTNTPMAGLRIYKISKTLPTGESLDTKYFYNDDNGHSTGQVYNNNYLNFQKIVNFLVFDGQTWCGVSGTNTSSESLYNSYDLNGNFIGYSAVKIVNPNGGYEVDKFTNFSDFPDQFLDYTLSGGTVYGWQQARQLSAFTSLSYKRGLLLNKTIFTASGNMVSSTVNGYAALDAVSGKAPGLRVVPYTLILGSSVSVWLYGEYVNNVENYVLAQTVQTNYDVTNQALVQQNTTTYTYAANHRLISRIDYTDSKGLPRSKTLYHTEDNGIPMVNGNEQYAIDGLLSANNTNAVIHTIESHNGNLFHTHNSYLSFRDAAVNRKILLGSKKTYHNSTSNMEEEQFQYDLDNCNLTAVNKLGAPFLSTLYGYNNCYIVAKVRNALNFKSATFANGTGSQVVSILEGEQGIPYSPTIPITVDYQGNVTFQMFPYHTPLVAQVSCTMVGTVNNYSGTACIGGSCNLNSILTIPNVQPGTYQVTCSFSSVNDPQYADVDISINYPQYAGQNNSVNGFFYEGFEELPNETTDIPYAGRQYNAGSYTVPFSTPDSRSYQIDYHYLSAGVWHAVTKPYTNFMVLNDGTGIDEVRVYPTDAQMVTYTYDPLVGITSRCDERNRFTFYQYDGFGRLKLIRDSDGNILNTYDYQYQISVQ